MKKNPTRLIFILLIAAVTITLLRPYVKIGIDPFCVETRTSIQQKFTPVFCPGVES